MRMPGVDAVLFDYGRTLVTFEYPTADLLEVLRRFRPRIEAASGAEAPAAESIMRDVLLPLEDHIESPDEDEVSYVDVYRDAWRRAGLDLPADLLYEILDEEQRCWDRAVRVDREAVGVLKWLRWRGIKRVVCSNAPFPAEMMRRQVESNGIADLVDAVLFSSQIGRRKPAPELYLAALDAVGVSADRALFVGDRVREDFEGPRAIGMRAVLCLAHMTDPPPDGIPTIASLRGIRDLL
jgi:HAD superfamily hydrolase (TIGR01509 family)